MPTTIHLDYQELRSISPKAARQAILQILKTNNGNVTKTARMFGITRATVYKALRKKSEGNLDNASKAPNTVN